MRLIIHAGVHRTGTTSLQKTLERNAGILGERGVYYPPGQGGRHRQLAAALAKGGSDGKAALDALLDGAPATADSIVLSNEDFSMHRDLAWLDHARSRMEVRASFYLLRQDLWVMSWYNQNVKSAWNRKTSQMTPAEFLGEIDRFHWIDYFSLLERWAKRIGKENIDVGVVETGQVTDVVGDFLRRFDLHPEGMDLRRPRLNRSLPAPVLEFARRMNHADLPRAKRQLVSEALSHISGDVGPVLPIYPPDARTGVIERFAESNGKVAEQYLERQSRELFLEGRVAEDAPFLEPALPASETLVSDIVQPFVARLLAT